MNKITIKNFNLGGVADSIFSGVPNSLARLIGWDLHSVAGLLQVAQKMTKISGSTITEFCKVRVNCSNGNKYWMSSSSGKIWKQDSNDSFTLLTTIAPTSGSAAILEAYEYGGYIYVATVNYLHRIAVSNEAVTANWQELVNHGAFHPMREVNLVLYIGDGNDVHQINSAHTYTAEALDLPTGYIITSLGRASTYLLIGAYLGAGISRSTIFRWNTWSVSYTNSDDVPEEGIWTFLEIDNYVLVYAGYAGNIYYYNMEGLEHYKRIAGTYSPTKKAIIHPHATGVLNGSIPLFGVSNVTGNPCDQGVWALGRHSRNYPAVLDLPFPISEVDGDGYNRVSGVEIGGIIVSGTNVYISWAYNSTYGVDKLDYSNKIAKPILETRIMLPDNAGLTTFSKVFVGYKEIPASTSIVVKTKGNYATDWSNTTEVVDSDRMGVVVDQDLQDARSLQLRVEAVSSVNTAPSIDEIAVFVE